MLIDRSSSWSLKRHQGLRRGIHFGLILASLLLGTEGMAAAANLPAERYSAESTDDRHAIAERFGIQIQSLRLSTAGYMLDFRHKVVDAEKAAYLHSYRVKPYVWDPQANVSVTPPSTKIGILRQGKNDAREGHVYTTMFANPGRRFKQGDRVTLVLGDLVVENIEIE